MAPLLGSNWTTFITLCRGVKENPGLGSCQYSFAREEEKPRAIRGYGFFKRLLGDQRHLCDSSVTGQVVAGAVGAAHDLDPALRAQGSQRPMDVGRRGRVLRRLLTYEVLVSASQQSQA